MTFGRGRIALGGKSNEWELTRFCNKINTSVIGGFSKLLMYFIKNNKPNKIITYADIRWFNGDLYLKNNFKFIHQTKPNYWYIIGLNRYHRFNYRKDVLVKQGFDANKSEHEIMLERKIYRIYDCGNLKFEWNV